MKRFVLCRFGFSADSRVSEALKEVMLQEPKPVLSAPFGSIISIFYSEKSLQEIEKVLSPISGIYYILSEEPILSFERDAPSESFTQEDQIESLKKKLAETVKAERYEEAASIQRQINQLQNQ